MSEPVENITFNRPIIAGRELDYIRQAVEAMHTSGDGGFSRKVHALLRDALEADSVFLTPSCTDALEMTGLLLDLQPGDEVILPAFSFVSSVNAYVLRGAQPVFADIRPDTLNLDEGSLEGLITPRTRAVVVVHYSGVGCEMDEICAVAARHDLPVIEDNAHGLFARYRGRPLGGLGAMSTLSFHETKNITCGEGGALAVVDPRFSQRAEIIRDKGTDRQRMYRGEVDKYTWVDVGSSFVLSDILAAFLYGQLEQRGAIGDKRRALWEHYDGRLRGWIEEHGVQLPFVPDYCEQSHHMYWMILPDPQTRSALIEHLGRQEIVAVTHYTPLHLSRMGRRFGGAAGQCPVTERTTDRLLRLPFYNDLRTDQQDRVVDAIRGFFKRAPLLG